jgi:membrane protein YqaA with SNARE-associated domain
MSDTVEAAPHRKSIRAVLFVAAYVIATVAIIAFIWFFQVHLRVSLKEYAPLAYLIVLVVSFLSASTILIPAPATGIVATAAAEWNPVIVAVVASIGASLGEMTSYYAGYFGRVIFKPEKLKGYRRASSWMGKYGMWAVLFFATIPIVLFDVVGLVAGGLKMTAWKFWLACWCGRLPRSFLEAYAGAGLLHFLLPSFFS